MTLQDGPIPHVTPAARAGVMRALVRRPQAVASLIAVLIIVLSALAATQIAGSPTQIDTDNILAAPSLAHPFGTDELGRDLMARVLAGGRISLVVASGAMAISMILGIAWGFVAASSGRFVDELLMRVADAGMAIPAILLALILVAAFGASILSLTIISGLLLAPITARLARSALLVELTSDYRLAARAVGLGPLRTVLFELFPNAAPPLIAQASLNIAWAIGIEASLSFLGLGIQPPDASWGTTLQIGYSGLYRSIWPAVFPALLMFIAIVSFNSIGTQLQRALDPRQEQK